MARNPVLELIVRAKDVASGTLRGVGNTVKDLGSRLRSVATSAEGLLAIFGTGLSASWLVEVNVEFERLRGQIRSFSRDGADAERTFSMLRQFAVRTPFELKDLTAAFVELRAAGLRPTEAQLTALGDLAAAMGGNIADLGEAVKAGAVGNMERLNRFGVVARATATGIKLTFQGVTTEVDRNATALLNAIVRIAEQNFAGSMERQAKTLGGSISNLKDAFDNLGTTLGEGQFGSNAQKAIKWMTDLLNKTRTWYREQSRIGDEGMAKQLADQERLAVRLRQAIANGGRLVSAAGVEEINAPVAALRRELASVEADINTIRLRQETAREEAKANEEKDRKEREAAEKAAAAAAAKAAAEARMSALDKEIAGLRAFAEARALEVAQVERLYALQSEQHVISRDLTKSVEERAAALQRLGTIEKALGASRAGGLTRTDGRSPEVTIPGVDQRNLAPVVLKDPNAEAAQLTRQFALTNEQVIDLQWNLDGVVTALQELDTTRAALTQGFAAFTDAIAASSAAMRDGSMSGAYAFETANKAAIANVAAEFARLENAKAIAAFTTGDIAGGFGHLAAATAFAAIGGAVRGSVNRAARGLGGVGGGAFGVVPTAGGMVGLANDMPLTVTIPYGFTNTADPRFMDALAQAFNAARGRRQINLEYRP